MCQNVSVAERLGVTPRWGRHGDTRSPAASGNRRSDAHAFDETANSHNQSTSEVAHWYETSTLTALGPGDTPYGHVSAGPPHSVPRSESVRDEISVGSSVRGFRPMKCLHFVDFSLV